ncbi:MAG: penicillin-binding protein 2 [Fimbriimonadia bacterium]|nr:penicillin-binding protein 2 [Fimbriimonadia bacterium]
MQRSMQSRPTPQERTAQQDQFRILLATVLMTLGLALIVVRLVQLQIFQAQELAKKADENRATTIRLPAQRGAILDRNHQILVCSEKVGHVGINPQKVGNVETASQWLAKHLQVPKETLKVRIIEAQREDKTYTRVARSVPRSRLEAMKNDYQTRQAQSRKQNATLFSDQVGELSIEEFQRCRYPNGSLAAHALGYVNVEEKENEPIQLVARDGLQKKMDEMLAGKDGFVSGEKDPSGWIIPEAREQYTPPVNGTDVVTTLDLTVQSAVESALDKVMNKHRPKGAIAIVMDPTTGEVLALANRPTFTPNSKSPALPSAYTNQAAMFRIEPGSIFKPITVAYALQTKSIRSNQWFQCNGKITVGKTTLTCDRHGHPHGHGSLSLESVLSQSCNTSMVQIANALKPRRMYDCANQFGLLQPTQIEFPYEARGYLTDPSEWHAPQLRAATISYGQGIDATPLGIASAYCVLANDGVWVQPHIVLSNRPIAKRQVISPEIARMVRQWLVKTVETGTGKAAAVEGYTLSGKTGTARKPREIIVQPKPGDRNQKPRVIVNGYDKTKHVASFVGFVPADQPKAVVLVMIDEPKEGYYGGAVAAPVFRDIAQQLIWYWKLPKDIPVKR